MEKEKQKKPGFVPGGGLPAIPGTLVERIREGDWVDFQDLLPENIMEQFKDEKDKRRKNIPLEKFLDRVLSFALFAAVIAEKEPGRGLELFQYLGVVTQLARDSPGFQWLEYDNLGRLLRPQNQS